MVIGIILISCGVYGYILNCINTILNDLNQLEYEKLKGLFTINKYMRKKNISKALQNEVKQYLTYVMQETKEEVQDE